MHVDGLRRAVVLPVRHGTNGKHVNERRQTDEQNGTAKGHRTTHRSNGTPQSISNKGFRPFVDIDYSH